MNQNYSLNAHLIIVVFWSSLLIRENFSLYLNEDGTNSVKLVIGLFVSYRKISI
jgi:hypothetical protein